MIHISKITPYLIKKYMNIKHCLRCQDEFTHGGLYCNDPTCKIWGRNRAKAKMQIKAKLKRKQYHEEIIL